jgi:hypothetical protein
MAQLTNGNAAERKPCAFPKVLSRSIAFRRFSLVRLSSISKDLRACKITSSASLNAPVSSRCLMSASTSGLVMWIVTLLWPSTSIISQSQLTNPPPWSSRTDYLAFAKDYELFALLQKLRYRIQASLRAVAR